ncbi:hypothetical protein HAX54_007336 [Datura stramonium]|uniref:Non-specific serine/threonine protein kinase n=1 Tax=Datura stramonium TaxID=4076 RepID=A0ABS8TE29_DATST|nr:hypothetical protein [Datura stramonium]
MELSHFPTSIFTGKRFLYLILLEYFIPILVTSQSPATTEHDILLKIKHQIRETHYHSTRGILLQEKDFTVEIPSSICDLKNLTFLNLAWNFLPGKFPTFLCNCSNLQHLDLSQNYFVGPIPTDIHRLQKLKYLNLGKTISL